MTTDTTATAQTTINLRLQPGEAFTPEKCGLCEAKAPPHPAVLTIEGPLGASYQVLCARCDTALTKLAALVGPGQTVSLSVAGTGQQTDMFGELGRAAAREADADDDEGDADGRAPSVGVAGLLEVPVDPETGEVFRR